MAVKTIEKPDVFHIGYSKAASTWLQEYLRLHDEIFLLFKSNFFLKDVYTENSISDYQKLFPVSSSYKLTIESDEHIVLPIVEPQLKISATNYDSVKERALKIHKLMPHIKIILIIRNQTDIILSRYIQYIKGGGSISFSKFFSLLTSENGFYKYLDYRYYKVIALLYEIFSPQKVFVILCEDLKSVLQKKNNELSYFLGYRLSTEKMSSILKKNISPSYIGVKLLAKLNRLLVFEKSDYFNKPRTRIPYEGWQIFYDIILKMDRMMVKKQDKQKLASKNEIKSIHDVFSDDNKLLSKMFGKSIKEKGYYYNEDENSITGGPIHLINA